jgi:glutathione S-transferase
MRSAASAGEIMKLHWSPKSPFVRKVMIFAHETALADRITLVRSVAFMTKPNATLMRDNPLNKIPTLVLETGHALFDSAVICEYLDGLHTGRRLFPESGPERWQALRRQALGDGLLDVLILWRNERERDPIKQLPPLLDALALKTRCALTLLEEEAAELDAAPFGIGHIAIGCALGYIDFRFANLAWRDTHPRLAGWQERFGQRAPARLTLPADDP